VVRVSVDAAAPPGGVTVAGLYRALCNSAVSVLVMDVRSRDDYNLSHIKSTDCINVPSDRLQLGFVLSCCYWRQRYQFSSAEFS